MTKDERPGPSSFVIGPAMKYAQIVVNLPLTTRRPGAFEHDAAESLRERVFTYAIPAHLADTLALGQLVWVPFGTRRVQGIVVAFSETSPVETTREIETVVDPRPFLSAVQIDLARWIARTYLCSLYEALGLMLPPGVEQHTEILIALVPEGTRENLTEKQTALVEYLTRAGETRLRALPRELHSAIEPLVRRGIIVKRSMVTPAQARPKRVQAVRLIRNTLPDALAHSRLAARFTSIVEFLRRHTNAVWISAVYAETGCTRADLQKLASAGIIALETEEVWRDPLAGRVFDAVEPPTLTPEQEHAFQQIVSGYRFQVAGEHKSQTFLLHGVTGSGKTEIYLRVLAEIIAQGKQGIVLVPEISLTPQTIRRFGARFQRIAVIHSQLSIGERYDTWRRCREGMIDVVIGARSALFAPLPALGVIVLDEEHDPSYKQAEAPRYHARAVALELARLTGAIVILGDATPDLETYYRARRGEFTLIELPRRVMGHRQVQSLVFSEQYAVNRHQNSSDATSEARYLELPPVEVVDLRAELKAGNRSMFSRALQREIARVLAAHEQAILFLNRRGTATFILCRDCGYVFKCRRCDNPMTYHGSGEQLMCHHCNRRDRAPTQCPQCRSARIRYFGIGTEKVEAEIRTLFPNARTLRWDWDVTRGKQAHEAILEKFAQRHADILIGTQMIAKGLDMPFVTLVGVISADTLLNLPDFRAGERTFQLLAQVAGRAGRSRLGGKVIVQTYNPTHYAVVAAAQHDYGAFYEHEIAFRRAQGYPPFNRLIRLIYHHTSEKRAQEESARLSGVLRTRMAQRGLPALDLIGPVPAFFRRVRGEYRYQIIVRGQEPHALLADLALPLGWRVDVDPLSVL